MSACPFCAEAGPDTGTSVAVIPSLFPSRPGHMLVIPRRHVARLTDLTTAEHEALFRAVRTLLATTSTTTSSAIIGINDGPDAGQTIPHLHVHVIPALPDSPAARYGVRNAFPDTADYHHTQDHL